MPRSEERGGMAARSVTEEQKPSWFRKPRLEGRGSLLRYRIGGSRIPVAPDSRSAVFAGPLAFCHEEQYPGETQ